MCAASAYIVVWTALIKPPVMPSMTRIGVTGDCGPSAVVLSQNAQPTAATAIDTIVVRDPKCASRRPATSAPATPPRLNAVRPLAATLGPRPAPVRIDGN